MPSDGFLLYDAGMKPIPTYAVNDGTSLPAVGFGTYPLRDREAVEAVGTALAAGYRLIDTAQTYRNEDQVGQAVRSADLPQSEVIIQTKIPGGAFGRAEAIAEVDAALNRLQVSCIDVMLIHWTKAGSSAYVDQWKALVAGQEQGKIRSIGVSNFDEDQLRRIIGETGVTPAVHQIELHPLLPQEHLRAVHAEWGILTQAWSPLGKEKAPFEAPAVQRVAREHSITPAQAILRWHIELGTLPLPKSSQASRQAENLDIFGYRLSAEEVREISALGAGSSGSAD